MMRVFALSVIAAACVIAVGCSDSMVNGQESMVNGQESMVNGQIAAQLDYYIKIDGIKGGIVELEEAMDIYSGNGSTSLGLLVPAVQKVREAAAQLDEGADRAGNIDAGEAEKTFRKLISSYKPDGDGYSLKEICGASTTESKHGHREQIEILSYGKNDPANVEYQLFHIFNGARIIMDDAGVDDDAIDRAMDNLLLLISELSDERPEA